MKPGFWDGKTVKKILAKHEYARDAAKELGVTLQALYCAFNRRGDLVSKYLKTPHWKKVMPKGHRLKGNSSLVDQDNKLKIRWVKSERASDEPPAYDIVPEGHLVKSVSTLVDGQGQVRAQWVQAPKQEAATWVQFWAAAEKHVKKYKGISARTPVPALVNDDLLTLYPLGDPHIGLYVWARETGGQSFDLKIAERDLLQVVDMLVELAPASKVGVLANVGDFFHAENDKQLTPQSGHKLDCDNRWLKIAEMGLSIMRRAIDRLLQKHEIVYIVNTPGNHDPQMARVLALLIKSMYEKEPRVVVMDNANPITYLRFGSVLFGFAHGDTIKPEQLPGVMATDRAEDWGATTHRVWITGHVHHTQVKEFPGCTFESFRTLAPRDNWHNGRGYRSGQSLSCITYDKTFGERFRSKVDIRLAHAKLGVK